MDPAFAAAVKLMMPAIESVMRTLGPEDIQGILGNGQGPRRPSPMGRPSPAPRPAGGPGRVAPRASARPVPARGRSATATPRPPARSASPRPPVRRR
jgi:hypothetical protein